MNALKTLMAGAALAVTATAGNAAVYATNVIDFNLGTCRNGSNFEACNPAIGRHQAQRALNAPDGKFVSLGYGGDLTLGFGVSGIVKEVKTWEVTYSAADPDNYHLEAVDVYAVLSGVTSYIGRILAQGGSGSITGAFAFDSIKLVDATFEQYGTATSSFDGFDVDAVSVAAVPLPAAGVLLLAGLGGLAAMRRRKTAA